jgi:hypothetical protein
MSHVLLESSISKDVRQTPRWTELGELVARVTVNGVSIPAEEFEACLRKFVDQIESQVRKEYSADAFDEQVERKAEAILQHHADNVLETFEDLRHKLSNIGDVLTPYWERK